MLIIAVHEEEFVSVHFLIFLKLSFLRLTLQQLDVSDFITKV